MQWRGRALAREDVYVAAYPKSGSTWLRFVIARMLGGEPDFESVAALVPPLGWHGGPDALRTPDGGRVIKVHEPASRLRKTPQRAILLVRDGRDVAISYYHHQSRIGSTNETFASFVRRFAQGQVDNYGNWADHVFDWLDWPGKLLVLSYEGLLQRSTDELRRLADFLGIEISEGGLVQIDSDCRPEKMRQQETQNETVASSGKRVRPTAGFVRNARAEQWREDLPEELRTEFSGAPAQALRRLGYPLE